MSHREVDIAEFDIALEGLREGGLREARVSVPAAKSAGSIQVLCMLSIQVLYCIKLYVVLYSSYVIIYIYIYIIYVIYICMYVHTYYVLIKPPITYIASSLLCLLRGFAS